MSHLISAYTLAALAIVSYLSWLYRQHRDLKRRRAALARRSACSPTAHAAAVALLAWLVWPAGTVAALEPASVPSQADLPGKVGGLVVDGSHRDQPLAGASVVLRGVVDNQLVPLAETTADEHGHFEFTDLPVSPAALYVAGVNRDGVHYPGPRLALFPDHVEERVRLVAYEGLRHPSPLVAVRHDIDIQASAQFLEITESIVVMNPTLRGFIGDPGQVAEPTTLELRPFPGFETVTFHNESLGRQFSAHDHRLTTSLPWPPGQRDIRFTYRIPLDSSTVRLQRLLTLPCRELRIRCTGVDTTATSCNLPGLTSQHEQASVTFTLEHAQLPADQLLELSLGGLSLPWQRHLKWLAVGALLLLVLAAWSHQLRRAKQQVASAERSPTTAPTPVSRAA